jgi:hypothetical protein
MPEVTAASAGSFSRFPLSFSIDQIIVGISPSFPAGFDLR